MKSIKPRYYAKRHISCASQIWFTTWWMMKDDPFDSLNFNVAQTFFGVNLFFFLS